MSLPPAIATRTWTSGNRLRERLGAKLVITANPLKSLSYEEGCCRFASLNPLKSLSAMVRVLNVVHTLGLLCVAAAATSRQADSVDLQDIYIAGQNDTAGLSYTCFRIPSLVRTKTGAIIAFAEGRRGSCSDQGDVKIVSRRSTDNGISWSPIEQVRSENGHTIGNPAPITDLNTGTLWLLYARDDNEVFVASSDTDGASWSPSTNLTATLKPNPDPKSWVATGPPGGVQLPSGRLVTAAYFNRPDGGTRAYAVYSDDHGRTWQHGAAVGINTTPGTSVYGGGESQVVPFGGGEGLAMLIRARTTFSEDVSHNHALAFSTDGGATFSNSSRMSGIKTVYCEGSMAAADNGDLLMSSPDSSNGVRINITLWAAPKETPTDFKYLFTLYSGSSAYSSMLSLQNGGDYINLFERDGSQRISLARFRYP